ncbi:hypothetical protein WOLCODRAFT_137753 [Wolfiporia cocos MD-104 SS10]|uniref:Uncharacterized protein n=1 Tax=Wolfiporia cocos (strain MD-104) TaxID=742152 RepID=A0A2H3JWG3_WOLCO|nr:hypothetical protein WOLCODRAFT_137753 [Wolfiporia cocos MD-104 SS10]
MFTTLVSVALFSSLAIRGARADFDIDTPTLTQCEDVTVTWDSTNSPPYNLIVVPSDDVCGDELADLGDFNGTSATWKVNIAAGTAVTFSLQDATGDEAWSGSMTIQGSSDSSCLNSTAASVSGALSSVLSSVVASTDAAASTAVATTLFASSDSSATPVANDAPASATTSAAIAVGAANTGDNPTSAGFSMHQLSTPIMIVSALAAFVLSM